MCLHGCSYMKAATPHMVITMEPSVMSGAHYLSAYGLHHTLAGMIADVITHHDYSNAHHDENEKYFFWITRYVHDKLTPLSPSSREDLESALQQSHVPLPFLHEGILSLFAILAFNCIGPLISPQRWPYNKPNTEKKLTKDSRMEFVESRRLS